MRFVFSLLVFIPILGFCGSLKWVSIEFPRETKKLVEVQLSIDRASFDRVFKADENFLFLSAEIKIIKKRRFLPDVKKRRYKIERKLKNDPVRKVWVVVNDREKIFQDRESALKFFLSPVSFKIKKKYFGKKYKVKARLVLTTKVLRFPFSRFFHFGKKMDTGFFRIKYAFEGS